MIAISPRLSTLVAFGYETIASSHAPVSELVKNHRILDLRVTSQEQHLGDHFGCLRVVVGERQEQSAAVLGVDRDDAQCAARELVDDARCQVNAVVPQLAVHQGV